MDTADLIDILADAWSKLDALREYDGLTHGADDTDSVAMIDIDALLARINAAENSLRATPVVA